MSGLSAATLLAGCGSSLKPSGLPAQGAAIALTGNVHGGKQPVSGARIYLYAVSITADAGPATSLLTPIVPGQPGFELSDLDGNWSVTGDYTCPAGSYVYLLSVGGNPGLVSGVNNAQLVLAAGAGCLLVADGLFVFHDQRSDDGGDGLRVRRV